MRRLYMYKFCCFSLFEVVAMSKEDWEVKILVVNSTALFGFGKDCGYTVCDLLWKRYDWLG